MRRATATAAMWRTSTPAAEMEGRAAAAMRSPAAA
jgi:hypothetical protein